MLKNLKHLLTNTDVSLVYGLVLLFYFSVALLFTYLPIIVVEKKLGYDIQIFNIQLLIHARILIMFKSICSEGEIWIKICFYYRFTFVLLIIILICLQEIKKSYTKPQNIGLLAMVMKLLSFVFIGELDKHNFLDKHNLFLASTILKFLKPDIQRFAMGYVACVWF